MHGRGEKAGVDAEGDQEGHQRCRAEPAARGRPAGAVEPDQRRLGVGFMGVGMLEPGEFVAEHYHPDSEEFLFLVRGRVEVTLGGGGPYGRAGCVHRSVSACPRVRTREPAVPTPGPSGRQVITTIRLGGLADSDRAVTALRAGPRQLTALDLSIRWVPSLRLTAVPMGSESFAPGRQ